MREIVFIAVAGALGAVSRYAISMAANRYLSESFPVGTLIVNVLGCFIIGYVMHAGLVSDVIPATLRVAVTVGFLGGLTTFSSFSYETVKLIEDSSWWLAAGNIGVNVLIGIPATVAGIVLGRITLGAA